MRDDSDLGTRLVTRAVPPLPADLVATALDGGAAEARAQVAAGRIIAAVLSLQGRWRVVGELHGRRDERLAPSAAPALRRPRVRGRTVEVC